MPQLYRNQPAAPLAVEAIELRRSLPLGNELIPILNGVSFAVPRGEWVTLMGPSGSGKSMLLGIIAGLDTPSGGRIIIDGTDITHMAERHLAHIRNAKIGIVFQSFNLIPTLTAQENVEAPLYVSKHAGDVTRCAREMLHMVGLDDRCQHRPHQLSGGQQQRVAIARALVTAPALLIADEPTGNLDSKTGAQVLDLFAKLHNSLGITVFVATHDPATAAHGSRTLRLIDGRLEMDERVKANGRPAAVLEGTLP